MTEDPKKRAMLAQQILDNPLFAHSVDSVRQRIVDEMARMPIDSDTKNAKAILGLQMLDRVVKMLTTHIQTGQMLDLEEERKKRFRIF